MKTTAILMLLGLSFLALAIGMSEAKPGKWSENKRKIGNYLHEAKSITDELMKVEMPDDEQTVRVGGEAILPCRFTVCPRTIQSVKVTWKMGNDPNTATRIAECPNYDVQSMKCPKLVVYDAHYEGRVGMSIAGAPALTIRSLVDQDNRNYWCQVQGNDYEYGTDTRSVVVRVEGSPSERPKFNHVFLDENLHKAKSGENAVLKCSCVGYHCDDVAWYKGPTNEWGNNFELVYKSETAYGATPTIEYGADWKNRIAVDGYALTIYNVKAADAGRYWCKASSASYLSLGETGTDAKSVVLSVDRGVDSQCL